jgi:2'-5' RNA ligase
MAIRTFLAIDLDEPIRRELVAAAGQFPQGDSKVRWVAPENLHVTVKFLGEVADEAAGEVCRAAAEVAGRVEPFDFDVRGLRCVPPGRKMRMIWAGVHEPGGRMAAMFEQLEAALQLLGFPPERRQFQPHITLARITFTRNAAGMQGVADQLAEAHFGSRLADGLVVYQSQLTPGGPIYTPMARAAFGAP